MLKNSECRLVGCFYVFLAAVLAFPAGAQTFSRHVPGYLGIGVIELADKRGVEVKLVERDSPAEKAGIKEDDVILEVNGKAIEDLGQFSRAIAQMTAGAKVNLTLLREGAKQNIAATLEARRENVFFAFPDVTIPPLPPVPGGGPFPIPPGSAALIGFEGETLSPQLAEFFGVKDGVLVRTVKEKTPAEKAGLKAGDVVVKVNGTPVVNPREISGLARASRRKTLSFTVVRNKKEITLDVEPADN